MSMTSIIIPAFNQLEYCRQCIDSIRAHTHTPYRLILVDNGSTDGVSEFFDTVAGAVAVHTGRNLGFAAGINAGLAHAEGHALLLNSDTIVPDISGDWLARLTRVLTRHEDAGLVGPRSNCVSGSQQIDGLELTSMGAINAVAGQRAVEFDGQVRDVARLVGFCLLIRDRVWKELGGLDEAYGIGNYEDDDYCVRALRAGWRLCVAEDAFVFHYGSRTFMNMGMVGDAWNALVEENQKRFQDKWALQPEDRLDHIQESRQRNREARAALARGDTIETLKLFAEAVRLAPHEAQNYNDLGAVLWQAGERERAITQFLHALRLDPANADARENLRRAQADGAEPAGDLPSIPPT